MSRSRSNDNPKWREEACPGCGWRREILTPNGLYTGQMCKSCNGKSWLGVDAMWWTVDAACDGELTETYYPDERAETASRDVACGECPVQTECLNYALDNRERYGVWGGTVWKQRAVMLRERDQVAS